MTARAVACTLVRRRFSKNILCLSFVATSARPRLPRNACATDRCALARGPPAPPNSSLALRPVDILLPLGNIVGQRGPPMRSRAHQRCIHAGDRRPPGPHERLMLPPLPSAASKRPAHARFCTNLTLRPACLTTRPPIEWYPTHWVRIRGPPHYRVGRHELRRCLGSNRMQRHAQHCIACQDNAVELVILRRTTERAFEQHGLPRMPAT